MGKFTSSGRLRYGQTTYWLVLDCDLALCEYYSHLYYLWSHKTRKLQLPAHGAHITVNAGKYDTPPNLKAWKAYQGERVEFTYEPNVKHAAEYFWLPVECQRLKDIRAELGLNPEPYCPLHLTIGNTKNDSSVQAVDNGPGKANRQ